MTHAYRSFIDDFDRKCRVAFYDPGLVAAPQEVTPEVRRFRESIRALPRTQMYRPKFPLAYVNGLTRRLLEAGAIPIDDPLFMPTYYPPKAMPESKSIPNVPRFTVTVVSGDPGVARPLSSETPYVADEIKRRAEGIDLIVDGQVVASFPPHVTVYAAPNPGYAEAEAAKRMRELEARFRALEEECSSGRARIRTLERRSDKAQCALYEGQGWFGPRRALKRAIKILSGDEHAD